ncbi:GGDEF domain-containing phosphodiesterase [Aurantimonas sp. Leaf443]|uniref:putative bifunctional diguanylate cyclase/phosphodiesterase n=1 Tax=Aurantimonas sp. Leaf443 TaxID=1736378 RepID=UPI000701BAE2|nr:GGDEF domain-containing phosphodiesterase [Aurantimonas sp. Leaf443]KQT87149.1 hypothetical protein ASG48_17480 [Aurantimonas sp. Leaf443]
MIQSQIRLRFRRLAESLPDAVVIVDKAGRVLFWNAGAEALFGHRTKEARALHFLDLADLREGEADEPFATVMDRLAGAWRRTEARTRGGERRLVELSLARWQADGVPLYGAIFREVSHCCSADAEPPLALSRDALTGLADRAAMRRLLEEALAQGEVGVLLVDLDGFKLVNDTLGHAAGDAVLREAAARLLGAVRLQDCAARIGADEFVVLLPGCCEAEHGAAVAARVVAAMEMPFSVGERLVHIGASVGLALAPLHAGAADEILRCADLAVRKAKTGGRHRYRLYDPSLRIPVAERQRFVHEFHRALENEEFVLHYQPQLRLRDRRLVGAEALIRWNHPTLGLLPPGAFLPALLSGPHAVAMSDWVLDAACRQAVTWLERAGPEFRMGVNACLTRLRSGDIADTTLELLARLGLPARNLELEITEDAVLSREEASLAALRQLRQAGVGIAFDDFGTGYASLSLLEDFPLTRVKIDRSFVQKLSKAPDVPVVRAILQLAAGFGLEVIAEGVETQDQLERLRLMGCAEGQGYLFGRPVPARDFADAWLRTRA